MARDLLDELYESNPEEARSFLSGAELRGGNEYQTEEDGPGLADYGKAFGGGVVGAAEDMTRGVEWLSNAAGVEGVAGGANTAADWLGQQREEHFTPEQQSFGTDLAGGAGSFATFFLPGGIVSKGIGWVGKGVTAGTKAASALAGLGIATSTGMEAMAEAGGVYEDLKQQGADEQAASDAATKTFWSNAALIGATNKLGGLFELGRGANAFKRGLRSAPMEGLQEFGQSGISQYNTTGQVDLSQAGYEGVLGTIIGGGAGVGVGLHDNRIGKRQSENYQNMLGEIDITKASDDDLAMLHEHGQQLLEIRPHDTALAERAMTVANEKMARDKRAAAKKQMGAGLPVELKDIADVAEKTDPVDLTADMTEGESWYDPWAVGQRFQDEHGQGTPETDFPSSFEELDQTQRIPDGSVGQYGPAPTQRNLGLQGVGMVPYQEAQPPAVPGHMGLVPPAQRELPAGNPQGQLPQGQDRRQTALPYGGQDFNLVPDSMVRPTGAPLQQGVAPKELPYGGQDFNLVPDSQRRDLPVPSTAMPMGEAPIVVILPTGEQGMVMPDMLPQLPAGTRVVQELPYGGQDFGLVPESQHRDLPVPSTAIPMGPGLDQAGTTPAPRRGLQYTTEQAQGQPFTQDELNAAGTAPETTVLPGTAKGTVPQVQPVQDESQTGQGAIRKGQFARSGPITGQITNVLPDGRVEINGKSVVTPGVAPNWTVQDEPIAGKKQGKPVAEKTNAASSPEKTPTSKPAKFSAASLRKAADGLQNQIDNKFADRQTNTPKRAREAEGQRQDGMRLQGIQSTLRKLADAHEQGTIPESLTGVRTKAAVESLNGAITRARDYTKDGRPFVPEKVRLEVYIRNLGTLLDGAKGKKGVANIKSALPPSDRHGGIYISTKEQAKALEDLLKLTTADPYDIGQTKEELRNLKRFHSMGITTDDQLRQAVEDYRNLKEEKREDPKAKALREKEQNLRWQKIPGFFPTPAPLVNRVLDEADIQPGQTVLEPSAGIGDIAVAAQERGASVEAVEINPSMQEILKAKDVNVVDSDFTEMPTDKKYDRIVMNPPFEKGQDITHVQKAYEHLAPGGKLVAIMSAGPFFRSDNKATGFREWLDEVGGTAEELPADSFKGKDAFKETGTRTYMVTIEKEDGGDGRGETEDLPSKEKFASRLVQQVNEGKQNRDAVLSNLRKNIASAEHGLKVTSRDSMPGLVKKYTDSLEVYRYALARIEEETGVEEPLADPSFEELETYDLIRKWGDNWQYKMSATSGGWYTSNSKEGAEEMARKSYRSASEKGELLTPQEKVDKADKELFDEYDRRYGHLSEKQIEQELLNLDGSISDGFRAGKREFNGTDGRRTSAAVSNQGAREAGEEKLKLNIYLKERKRRLKTDQEPPKPNNKYSIGYKWEGPKGTKEIVGQDSSGKHLVKDHFLGGNSLDIMDDQQIEEQERIDKGWLESKKRGEEKERVRAEKEAKAKAEREDIDGFDEGMNSLRRGLAIKTLNKQVRHNGTVKTRKQFIRDLVSEGAELDSWEEDKIKDMSRKANFRATQAEQLDHARRQKEAGKKTVYSVGGFVVTKTEYDYAGFLMDKQTDPEPPKPSRRKTEKVDWFVNYTDQPGTGRTTESKRFSSLKDAKEFAKGKHGYITRQTDGGSDFDATAGTTDFVDYFGDFEPTAQEGETIKRLTGKDAPVRKGKKEPTPSSPETSEVSITEKDGEKEVEADLSEAAKDKLSLKQQKEWLLKEVDAAIAARKNPESLKLVEFIVPGDGHFRVKEADLDNFRKRVKDKFPEKRKKGRTTSMIRATQSKVRINEGEFYNDFEVRENKGLVRVIESNTKPKAKILWDKAWGMISTGFFGIKTGKKLPLKGQRTYFDQELKVAWPKEMEPAKIVGEFSFEHDENKAKSKFETNKILEHNARVYAHVRVGDSDFFVPADVVDVLLTKYPSAEVVASEERKVIGFLVDGNPVGFVMPFEGVDPTDYHKERMKELGVPFGREKTEREKEQDRRDARREAREKARQEEFEAERAKREQEEKEAVEAKIEQANKDLAEKARGNKSPSATKEKEQKTNEIDDFGEVLHGARKHYSQAYADSRTSALERDIATSPLSKVWPEPNYHKLIEDGVDPWTVSFIRAARDMIPSKPKSGWKLRGWVEQVKTLRGFAFELMDGKIGAGEVQAGLESCKETLGDLIHMVDLYETVGHEKSLKGLRVKRATYSAYMGKEYKHGKTLWSVESAAKKTAFSNFPNQIAVADTKEELLALFKDKYDSLDLTKHKSQKVRFEVYSYKGLKTYHVGKKIGSDYVSLQTFDNIQDARKYKDEHYDDLVKQLEEYKNIPKERKDTNSPRVGADHRLGADVTPEQFTERFGFRGVQFGNYVEGPRRQSDLNQAYDALMDLAGVLNIPTEALSLNGSLGLAFGARGKGGTKAPAAHYEPGTVVINLTKRGGAGSLAHEWFHALDNYFGKQSEGETYLSNETKKYPPNIRPELVQAYRSILSSITSSGLESRSKELDKRRTKNYWSTKIEMAARSFESYIIAKLQDENQSNDYLANIVSQEAYGMDKGYPYPTQKELPGIRSAFDGFFQTVEHKKTDKGTALYLRSTATPSPSTSVQEVQDLVDHVRPVLSDDVTVEVVKDLTEVDPNLQAQMLRDGASGAPGLYLRGQNKIILVAGNIADSGYAAKEVFRHELTHAGITQLRARLAEKMGGDVAAASAEVDKILSQIYLAKVKEIRVMANGQYQGAFDLRTPAGRRGIAEEWLAEQGRESKWYDRYVAKVRQFLRAVGEKLGFDLKFSDAEIRNLLQDMNQALTKNHISQVGKKGVEYLGGADTQVVDTYYQRPKIKDLIFGPVDPDVTVNLKGKDLSRFSEIFGLPYWIGKKFPSIGKMVDAYFHGTETKADMVSRSLKEVDQVWKLKNAEMKDLGRIVTAHDGLPIKSIKVSKFVTRKGADGKPVRHAGREFLDLNGQYKQEFRQYVAGLKGSKRVKDAFIALRESLDNDLVVAYNKMVEMKDVDDGTIKEMRTNIGQVHNYFPHHRYGEFHIRATNDKGEVVYREHYDSLPGRAQAEGYKLIAKAKKLYPDAKWEMGRNKKLPDEVYDFPIPVEAMEQIIMAAGDRLNDEGRKALKAVLPEAVADVMKTRGWGSHMVKRQGVPGHETADLKRVVLDYKTGLAGWIAKMDTSREFGRILRKIDAQDQRNVYRYATRYMQDMLRNQDDIDRMVSKIKAGAFAWYLGGNIKTAMVNTTQNVIIGWPTLSMHIGKSGQRLSVAAMNRLGQGKLKADETKLLDDLVHSGVATENYLREARGEVGASKTDTALRWLGFPMAIAEKFNRSAMALAAYRAARDGEITNPKTLKQLDLKKGQKASYETAKAFATTMVKDAHYLYGKGNTPQSLRSSTVGRVLSPMFTFRSFTGNTMHAYGQMLFSMGKEGRKAFAKSMLGLIALGGLTSVPLYASLVTLLRAFGDDDDDPVRDAVKDMDDDTRLMLLYGLPALAGVNLGGSLSMEAPLASRSLPGQKLEDLVSSNMGDLVGVTWDMMIRKPSNAIESYRNSDVYRMVEDLVPTFAANMMKAWRLSQEGQTSRSGTTIAGDDGQPRKLELPEAIGKVFGFQPVRSTDDYAQYHQGQVTKALRSKKQGEIASMMVKAIRANDSAAYGAAAKELQTWNQKQYKAGKPWLMLKQEDLKASVNRRLKGGSDPWYLKLKEAL